jgi:integrase
MELFKHSRSNVWSVDLGYVNGKRIRRTTKQTKRSAALVVATAMQQKLNAAGDAAVLERKLIPTLEQFATEVFVPWVENCTLSFNTKRYYLNGVRLLRLTEYGTTPLDQVCHRDVDTLKTTGGPSNTNNLRRVIRLMLSHAKEKKILDAKPILRTLPENERTSVFMEEMQQDMIDHAEQPLKDVAITIFDAGMRPAEIVRIQLSDFRWERGLLWVPGRAKEGHKSKKSRYVPVSERMAEIYRERFEQSPNEWAYPSPRKKGKHMSYFPVAKRFGQLREQLGIPEDLVLYSARHTFGTNLMQETGNAKIVQEVMGHEDMATTQKYLHPDKSRLAEIINNRNRANANKVAEMRAAREESNEVGRTFGRTRPFLVPTGS